MIWKLFFILCLISKQAFRNTISVQVDLSGMSQLAFRCHRFTWTNILSKRNWLAPKVLSDQRWHCWVENLMYYQAHWFQRGAPVREVHLNRWTSSDTHTKPLIFPPKDEIMTHHQQASVNECITNDTSSSQESRHRQFWRQDLVRQNHQSYYVSKEVYSESRHFRFLFNEVLLVGWLTYF